jgi:transcriptional regulator with XRE-family HTH domain
MKQGEALRTIRVDLGLSLREVAREASETHVHLGEYERGAVYVSFDAQVRIYGAMARLVEARTPRSRLLDITEPIR